MRVGLASHLLFLYLLQAGLINGDSVAAIRGLDPKLAAKYQPTTDNHFACLDGSGRIPFERVNDDYCDCPDGSDEPGTSACSNGTFYCANAGHVPGTLSASRVNDGVCDYDVCCDGSDEWDGAKACPDRCAELGAAHREREARLLRAQGAGARRLRALVGSAQGLRAARAAEYEQKRALLEAAEREYAEAEARKDALEARQRERAERGVGALQRLSDEYLGDVARYRGELAAELHVLRAQRDALIRMLSAVRRDHNVEFNDEAVATVVGEYGKFAEALPYMEAAAQAYADEDSKARRERELEMDRDSAEQDDATLQLCVAAVEIAESERRTANEDVAQLLGWMHVLRDGYNRNYHDLAVKGAVVALADFEASRERELAAARARHASADIGALKLRYEAVKPLLVAAAPADESSANDDDDGDLEKQVADARTLFWDKQSEKTRINNEVSNLKELLEEKDLGPRDMFLPVHKECYSLDAGEYTYEVCLLDRAAQIENKNNARQSLGSFAGFGGDDYSVLNYRNGAKCWNGPERSITVTFECADTIELLSVKEPEKCEYHATMSGPFACRLPGSEDQADSSAAGEKDVKEHVHDEL
ncbi:hypothetical protein IWW50_005482 [Coemansia erecta]|nr:hypothetical protein IWW50_005482 [Coemansia erecta]